MTRRKVFFSEDLPISNSLLCQRTRTAGKAGTAASALAARFDRTGLLV
jgi:hypothetical protein